MPETNEQTDEEAQQPPATPPQQFERPTFSLAWTKTPTERPPRPDFSKLGPEGFTVRMADVGSYAYVPDRWPYQNDTPRGSYPAEEMGLPAPYTIYDKDEVWADNAIDLYEAAIQERWAPATQISWNSLEPLPEHIEAAIDQVCTLMSEQQYNSTQVLSGWL